MVQDAYLRHGISSTVRPFFQDMTDCYRQADLMICRSGATTVAEITAIGKPAIFIPFPHASDNHQALNADRLVQSQAAEMILESDLTGSAAGGKDSVPGGESGKACAEWLFAPGNWGIPLAAENHRCDDCYALIG